MSAATVVLTVAARALAGLVETIADGADIGVVICGRTDPCCSASTVTSQHIDHGY
ncbi:hypothetical protein ACQPWR_19195 [Micromonospora vinacea]|uniref:hypothetical protein n=1 Tax=Micromonospora vinacea TaxID=709878 RepID=UPI003D8AD2C6